MPAVSVLVPCCNVEKYLRQCLDSVVNQTLRDVEIICINDGSTDSTPAILREYAARDPRIRIIDKENSGYGDSMNRGLEAAAGEYIGIVESDDWADADMFERLYAAAKEHDCDVVKSNFYDYRDGVSTLNEIIPPEDAEQVITPRVRTAIFTQTCYIWTDIYRRSWLERERIRFLPTPGASYQDMSFNFKALACAEKAWFMRDAFLHYRRDNENSSIYNFGKIYCVCDEYAEIERFVVERNIHLFSVVMKKKYDVYYWNFRRLAIPVDWTFCRKASEEFRGNLSQGQLEEQGFKRKHYRRLKRWADKPVLFYLGELLSRNGRRKLARFFKAGRQI